MTKKHFIIASALALCCSQSLRAQSEKGDFRTWLHNDDLEIFMHLDLEEQQIEVPGQELLGPLPGYLGKKRNSFCWLITGASVSSDKSGRPEALLQMINDYGSEDLEASLTRMNDSIYVLRQRGGSQLKVPKDGKWLKLPKQFELKVGR